jgi:hypothetical protein
MTTCDMFKAGLGPQIDVKGPAASVITISNGAYLKGTVAITGDDSDVVGVQSVSVLVSINGQAVGTVAATLSSGSWSASLDTKSLSGGKDTQAALDIKVTANSGRTTDENLVVYFDNTPPVFSTMTPSQAQLGDNKTYDYAISQIETISGSVNDFGLNTVELDLGSGKNIVKSQTTKSAFSFQVDASQFFNASTYAAQNGATSVSGSLSSQIYAVPYTLIATDLAGNTSSITGTLYVRPGPGAPIVTFTSPASFDTLAYYPYTSVMGNVNSTKPGTMISFQAFDMDGLDTSVAGLYVAYASGASGPDYTDAFNPASPGKYTVLTVGSGLTLTPSTSLQLPGGSTITQGANISFTMPTALGQYALIVHVADLASNKVSGSSAAYAIPPALYASTNSHFASIFVSNGNPQVTVSLVDGSFVTGLNTIGTVADASGPVGININLVETSPIAQTIDTGTNPHPVTVRAGDPSTADWSYAASSVLADGTYTLSLVGINASYAETSPALQRTFTVDTTPPTTTISVPGSYTSSQSQYWLSGATMSVSGIANDGTGSGVASVYYAIVPKGSVQPAFPGSAWTLAAGTGNWNGTISLGSLSPLEGEFTLYIVAKDALGNTTAAATSRNFGVDQNPPTLTETNHPASSYTKSSYTLAGSVGDTNALASLGITESKNSGTANTVNFTSTPSSLTGVQSATYTTASLPLSGVSDGSYAYVLTATDVAGKITTVNRTIKIDTTPPTVTLNAIPSWISSSAYTISGTGTDPNPSSASGVANVQYQLDGGAWSSATWTDTSGGANTTGTWSATLSGLAEGNHTLKIQSTDAAGNVSTQTSASFGVDLSPPSLTETVLNTTSQVIKNNSFTMSGSVSDTNPLSVAGGTLTVGVSVNGGAATAAAISGSTWSYTQPKVDGTYTYTITATDVAGKTTSLTRLVLLDSTPPTLTVTSPSSGGWVSTTSLSVTGVASDGTGSGVSKVYVKADGLYVASTSTDHSAEDPTVPANGWTLAGGQTNWSAPLALSGEGRKTLWIKALDAAGNMTNAAGAVSSRVDFGLDLNPPTLTKTDGVGSLVNASFTFTGTTTDTNPAGLPTLAVSVDGGASQAVAVTSGAWSYLITVDTSGHTTDGNHTYVFTATDVANKTTTLSRTITVDTTPPTMTITQPGNYTASQSQYWLSGSTASLGGSSADPGVVSSGVAKVYYKVDALATSHASDSSSTITNTWTLAAGTTTWSATANLGMIGEGQFTLWIAAYDNAGNLSTINSRNFGVDQNPPTLTETNHPASSYTKSSYTLAGSVGDTNALASLGITESKNSGTANTVNFTSTPSSLTGVQSATYTTASLPLSGVSDGSYAYVLTATDVAGKITTVNRTIKIDTTPPTVTLNAIPSWISSSAYTISGTGTDPNPSSASGVANVQYQLDGGAWSSATWTDTSGGANTTGTWSATLSGLAEGNHTLKIQSTDAAGNVSTQTSASFGVDLSPPSLTETVLNTTSQVIKNNSFTMSGSVSDTNPLSVAGGTLTVGVSVNGGAATAAAISGSTWSYTQPKVDGTYTYTITATDVAGKTTSLTRLVLLDSTPPTLTVTTPAVSSWTSSTAFSISGTGSDGAGSGVKNIYYLVDSASNDHTSDIAAWNATGGATAPVSGTSASWTATTGLPSSWSGSSILSGEGYKMLWVVASDKAGNTTTLTKASAGSFSAGTVYTIASIGTTDFTACGATSNTVGLTFTATGSGGGTGTAWSGNGVAIPFGQDLSPPSLTETAISTTSTVVRNANIIFSGSASDTDALAAAHSLTVSVDGGAAADVSFTTAPAWSYTYSVNASTHAQDGTHSFVFTANDIAGKTTTVTRSVLVDTTPATVMVSSPTASSWTNATPYTIAGTASDGAGAGIAQVWTIVDNATVSHASDTISTITSGSTWKLASGSTNWTASWPISGDGNKTLWVAVLDLAGNWTPTYANVNFGFDATPPALAITPMGGFRVAFAITGTAADAGSGLASLQYKIDSGSFSPITVAANWTTTLSAAAFAALAEGTHTVTVQAFDVAGNQTMLASTFNKDTTPPTLAFSNINAGGGTVDQDSSPDITGTLSDVSGVASASYTLQARDYATQAWNVIATNSLGNPAGATNWNWSLDLSSTGLNLPDGQYEIAVTSADVPGNSTTSSYTTFLLSRTNPTATISAPALGTFQNAAFPLVGTVSDPNGITSVLAKISSGSVSFTSGATAALPALPATVATGAPGVFAASSPHGLNVGDQVYLWAIPMPVAPAGALQTGTAYYVQSVPSKHTFTLAATSGGAALAINTSTATNLLVAAAKYSFSAASGFHPVTPLTITASSSTLTATNGNLQLSNGDAVYFQGQTLPTPVSAGVAYYVQNVNAAANTFQVSATAAGAAITFTSTGTWPTVYAPAHAVNWMIPAMPVAGFSDGALTAYVQTTAGSGKTSQTSRDFTLDTTAPIISITSPSSGTRQVGNLTIIGTTTDPGTLPSGVNGTIQYQIGNGYNLSNASSWSSANVTGGAYSWTITLGDMSAYANATYATQCDSSGNAATGTNLWKLPIVFQALDKAGNVAQLTSYYLILDPNGNIPVVTITQPATGLTFGGLQRVTGTATQPTWIYGVEVAIDPTGGNNFPANPVSISISGSTLTATSQPFTAGQMVFLSGTTAPQIGGTAVVSTTAYWVVNPSATSFQVSATSGGSPVTFSSGGSGVTASVWAPATLTTTGNSVIWYYDVNATTAYPQNAATSQTISLQARAWNSPTAGGGKGTLSGTLTNPLIMTFNSSFPQLQNVQVNGASYYSQIMTRGTISLTGTVSSSKGISKLESVESSPLSGSTTLYNTASSYAATAANNGSYWSSTVTPPTQYTAGSFPYGGSYKLMITSVGTTNWVGLGAPVAAVGTVFSPSGAGSGTGTAFASDSSGNFNYSIAMTLNSTVLYSNTTGQYAFNFRMTDMTSPTPQVATSMVTLDEDNYYPTSTLSNPAPVAAGSLATGTRYMILSVGSSDFTTVGASSNTIGLNFVATGAGSGTGTVIPVLTGTSVKIQGSATDTGTGAGPIQGLSKVVVYFTNSTGTEVLDLKNGGGAYQAPITLQAKDMANSGTIGSIVYPNTASYSNFFASIDTLGSSSTNGFPDSFMIDGNNDDWWVQFDTTKQNDGPVTIHFVVWDAAGNPTHYSQSAFISNNAPSLSTIALGTDLTGAGTINATQTLSSGFSATGFTTRNKMLSFTIDSVYGGSNGALNYSLIYGGHDYLNPSGQAGVTVSSVTTNSETVTLNFASISPSIPDTTVANGASFTIKVTDQTSGSNQSYTQAVALNIHNNDTVAPTINLAPFGQVYNTPTDSANGGVYTDTSKALGAVTSYSANIGASGGHIEYTSPITAGASSTSGQVVFKGKAWDDASIKKITATIPGFNGGAGSGSEFPIATYSSGALVGSSNSTTGEVWSFAVDSNSQSLSLADGHVLNWSFTWDSSQIATVTAKNVTITFKAYNNGSPSLSSSTSMIVDIVPYISKITSALSSGYASVPSVLNRSANGAYPVRENETLTIDGYNFNGSSTTVTANGTSLTVTPVSGKTTTEVQANIGTTATSGLLTATVNSVNSINNVNATVNSWNQEPNSVNNNTLTDHRSLDIWRITSVLSDATIRYPTMQISTSSTAAKQYIGWAYDEGENYYYMTRTSDHTSQIFESNPTQYYDTAFAFDEQGNTFGEGNSGDITAGSGVIQYWSSASFFYLNPSAGNPGATDLENGYEPVAGYKARIVGLSSDGTVANTNSNRVQNPDMIAALTTPGSSRGASNPDNNYLIYYDAVLNSVMLRTGTVTSAPTSTGALAEKSTSDAVISTPEGNAGFGAYGDTAGAVTIASSSTTAKSGSYSAIALDPVSRTTLVAVWYDSTNQTLWYSYNTQPTVAAQSTQWQNNAIAIDTNFAGWYCDVTVDGSGAVHVAYNRSSSGDLCYAYLPSIASTSPTVVTVDSYLSVGQYLKIGTLKNASNQYVPYISYYASSYASTADSVKIAWRSNMTSLQSGAVNDLFTNAWESMTLPLANIPKAYKVNIGFKDFTGTGSNLVPVLGYATNVGIEYSYMK